MTDLQVLRRDLQSDISAHLSTIPDEQQQDYLRYVFTGGRRVCQWRSLSRGCLILLLGGVGTHQLALARSVELLHHASLIVDDQIDKAHSRKGLPAFWVKYGPEECILFSHAMVEMALRQLSLFDADNGLTGRAQMYALRAIRVMTAAELKIRREEFYDLKTYLDHARRKTGTLYALAAQLAGLLPRTNISDLVMCALGLKEVGAMHQVLDDFVDASPDTQEKTIFLSLAAEQENCERSIYKLLKYGLTLDELTEFHREHAAWAIRTLDRCVRDGPEKESILRLCEEICIGASSGTVALEQTWWPERLDRLLSVA